MLYYKPKFSFSSMTSTFLGFGGALSDFLGRPLGLGGCLSLIEMFFFTLLPL
jgi:hypothetical protein